MNHVVASHVALKDAALYFDRFVPYFPLERPDTSDVRWLESFLQRRMGKTKAEFRPQLQRFVLQHYRVDVPSDLLFSMLPNGCESIYRLLLEAQFYHAVNVVLARSIDEMPEHERTTTVRGLQLTSDLVSNFVSDLKLTEVPLLTISSEAVTPQNTEQTPNDNPVLTIANLKLVDASATTWEQIGEIRSNKDAVRKLRRLRAFVQRSYEGKSRAFIEDDLLSRVADYEEEATKQGLQLVDAGYSVVSESPALLAVMAAALTLSSSAVSAALLAGTAAVAQLGKVVLRITKASAERRSSLVCHDAAYIVHLQRVLASEKR
jgi:hypothetical protein